MLVLPIVLNSSPLRTPCVRCRQVEFRKPCGTEYHGMPEFASASYFFFFLSPSSHVLFRLLGEGGEIHVRTCGQAHIRGTP